MSLDDVIPKSEGEKERDKFLRKVTVDDLISMYGKEAVIRGINYMGSLEKANRNYKEAVEAGLEEEKYEERTLEGLGVKPENASYSDASSAWKDAMEGSDLDLTGDES